MENKNPYILLKHTIVFYVKCYVKIRYFKKAVNNITTLHVRFNVITLKSACICKTKDLDTNITNCNYYLSVHLQLSYRAICTRGAATRYTTLVVSFLVYKYTYTTIRIRTIHKPM